ncbi:hypothetical protein PILCRDRAFT_827500 [Piloderma croceum F 1598]|uniref:Uncharacterized protein n=1 Tax=Piloderma croceum (strain F 1598) TaxID=765440 RepID=A0A0C3BD87_PILCF|nr:hypothetical protein PILCRDRAFT_827500 [Piloderma croceum F 1598]
MECYCLRRRISTSDTCRISFPLNSIFILISVDLCQAQLQDSIPPNPHLGATTSFAVYMAYFWTLGGS